MCFSRMTISSNSTFPSKSRSMSHRNGYIPFFGSGNRKQRADCFWSIMYSFTNRPALKVGRPPVKLRKSAVLDVIYLLSDLLMFKLRKLGIDLV